MPTIRQILEYCLVKLLVIFTGLVILSYLLIMRLIKGKDFFKIKPRPTPPAILNDPKWGNHKYVNLKSQGIRLHYVEAGDHQKPLIVCLHGIWDCWFSWRHQLQHLSQNYWVVAVDLRGYGDSDKPRASDCDMKLVFEDLREFLLTLGKDKCTLLGNDIGGVLAWLLVIEYPELFNYHISCNAVHPTVFNNLVRSWKQKIKCFYMLKFVFTSPWVPELMFSAEDFKFLDMVYRGKDNNVEAFPDEVMEGYKYYYSQKDACSTPMNIFRSFPYTLSEAKLYSKVTVPTLIIWGVKESFYSKDLATKNVNECESAEVKFVEEADHYVQQDKPKEVNNYIQEFLSTKL